MFAAVTICYEATMRTTNHLIASGFLIHRPSPFSSSSSHRVARRRLLSKVVWERNLVEKEDDEGEGEEEVDGSLDEYVSRLSIDRKFMRQAIDHAKVGYGGTFPNPAVGCVIVDANNNVVGKGFHPQAGFPHAEVFALFEASGAVDDGILAAKSVLPNTILNEEGRKVTDLLNVYASDGGASKLFGDCLKDNYESPITAYVTLEPCCHYGRTPPCAMTFVQAGVDRVVVGFRDPNPRVDGGGVKVLQENGVNVSFIRGKEEQACAKMVENFVKRITSDSDDFESSMTGAHRSVLRSLAGRMKADGIMPELSVALEDDEARIRDEEDETLEDVVNKFPLKARWLEEVDRILWSKEVILLRLGGVVAKKKAAKYLGIRIAKELGATVAQTVGHTVLLYRPGDPPGLNLNKMIEAKSQA